MPTPTALQLARLRNLCVTGRARSTRICAGLSLADVAKEVDTSHVSISRWERGLLRPRGSAAAYEYLRLLDALRDTTR